MKSSSPHATTLRPVNTFLGTRMKSVTVTVPGGWTLMQSPEAMAVAKETVRVVDEAATVVAVAEAPRIFFPFFTFFWDETILELMLHESS